MVVKELIDRLKTMDQDKLIYCIDREDNPLDSGYEIVEIFSISGHSEEVNNAVYIGFK